MNSIFKILVTLWFGAGAFATPIVRADATPSPGGEVDFARDIRPLLNKHCAGCHGGVKQAGGLSFVYRESPLKPAKSGEIPIVPGKPEKSELIARIISKDEDERMPPPEHGPALPDTEINLLRRWIQKGANWTEHWAFAAPKPQALPAVKDRSWPSQPLDHFILGRLEREKLKPSPAADRVQWLRRVTFDLTGLPPKSEEVEAFLKDDSSKAFEIVADRLLASPAFGERWTSLWMDLARYADSQGYEKDSLRTMWPYRDWLIRAFNADMPYDQFLIRQLAGDLLPDATLSDVVATAFHRNTPTNSEGGTDDEEFRVAAVLDRVGTTWEAFQGVTFKCIQCHSHPYDPIEHAEFYRFYDFFNSSKDWDLREDLPKLQVPLDEKDFVLAREMDIRLSKLRGETVAETERLAGRTQWDSLNAISAKSTGQTRLVLKKAADGATEVFTEGTVSHDSKFTLDFQPPSGLKRLTALRVDVLPVDPVSAKHTPELGFVISEIRAQVLTKDLIAAEKIGEQAAAVPEPPGNPTEEKEKKTEEQPKVLPGEIKFAWALGDESEPFSDAQAALNPDKPGWGSKPRLTHARRLVLVPSQPVELPEGALLRLTIRQEDAPNDLVPWVMNRSRYSISSDATWTGAVASAAFKGRVKEIADQEKERKAIKGADMPVMAEQDEHLRRVTAVFTRGDWLNKAEPVTSGIPKLFGALSTDAPADRLAMARWLVSRENPLTARVAVNRFWEQLFGIGLVETLEDFGSSGLPPSHPELLDFLALRFQNELGWSMKKLLRELVLSSTYRQDARVTTELRERDPRNRLLARGPRNRLTAEMVRDNALAVSGLLANKMFGPSVMPPQPDGIWRAARSNLKYETSKGEDRNRRALYTIWRRSSPYPSLMTFDAPNRLVCSARRETTNTPLQALVTLNDPVYVECAVALAGRMRAEGGESPTAQIAHGYKLATGRAPSDADLADLLKLHADGLAAYQKEPELAAKLAKTPEDAALALVANAILNLDVVLTK